MWLKLRSSRVRGSPVTIAVLLAAVAGCSSSDRPRPTTCGQWVQLSPSVAATCFATGLAPVDWSAGLEPLLPSGPPSPPMPVTRREEGPVSATLELLVLWRGTPGWFLRPASGGGSSVSFEDTVEYPRPSRDASRPEQAGGAPAGRRLGSTVTIRQGSVLLELRFDPESATVYVQEHPIRLNGDNVVLVDDVDGPAGPQVAGTLRIDPGFTGRADEPPFDGFHLSLSRAVEWLLGTGRSDEPPFDGFEVLLQRSEELLGFLRCDVPLPADLYPGRRSVSRTQRYMDEACARYGLPPATSGPAR